MATNESQEMYLKTILLLHLRQSPSRSVDVANELGFSKASVSRAVGILKKDGFITIQKGGEIEFTPKGRKLALAVYDRYVTIKDYLIFIGVDEENAERDACKMEHVISDVTFEKFKSHVVNDHKIYQQA